MLLLKLSEDCRMDKKTRNKDGDMVRLSNYTAEFLLSFCLFCMSSKVAELALEKPTPAFLLEQDDNK
jgi:hypothetical protein